MKEDVLTDILARFPTCRRVNQYSPGRLPYGVKNPVFYESTFSYITIKVWPVMDTKFDMTLRIGNTLVKEWSSKSKETFLKDLDECRTLVVQITRNTLVMLGEVQ